MKSVNKILSVIGYICIVLGIIIFIVDTIHDSSLKKFSGDIIKSVSKDIEEISTSLETISEQISENQQQNTQLIQKQEKVVDNLIGILEIPTLKLELPVSSSFNYEILKNFVARYRGNASQEPENLVIVGHNYKNHFGKIKNLTSEDYITFTNFYNETYKYYLTSLETIEDTDFKSLDEKDYKIAILTCNFDGSKRIIAKFN